MFWCFGFLFIFIVCVCVSVCLCVYAISTCMEVKVSSLLLCESQGWNTGHQSWHCIPLPAEPSHQTRIFWWFWAVYFPHPGHHSILGYYICYWYIMVAEYLKQKELLIWAHGFTGVNPSWRGSCGRAEWLSWQPGNRKGIQEGSRARYSLRHMAQGTSFLYPGSSIQFHHLPVPSHYDASMN